MGTSSVHSWERSCSASASSSGDAQTPIARSDVALAVSSRSAGGVFVSFRSAGNRAAWIDTRGALLPVKKAVSTSTASMTPRRPSCSRHQSWPGTRLRRVSHPSIHLPKVVNSSGRKTGGSGSSRWCAGANHSSVANSTRPPSAALARSVSLSVIGSESGYEARVESNRSRATLGKGKENLRLTRPPARSPFAGGSGRRAHSRPLAPFGAMSHPL